MKKSKYISLFAIILSIFFGYVVYAEETSSSTTTTVSPQPVACTMDAKMCSDGVTYVGRTGPNCEFAKCPGEKDPIKGEIRNLKDEKKTQLDAMIESIKDKRAQFESDIQAKKQEAQIKITEMRAKFQDSLKNIKDENKKKAATNIIDIIETLNTKITGDYSKKVNEIESVLVNIQSRITKEESKNIDLSSVKAEVEKSKVAIQLARIAITTQTPKIYVNNVTDEAKLKEQMKALRNSFTQDVKKMHDAVKQAHDAVKVTATTLAKIPEIAETDVTKQVENNNNQ